MVKDKATVRAKVIGPNAISGVNAPGEVTLDPEETNIPALVQSGHVELIDPLPEDEPPAANTSTGRKAKDKG